MSIFNEKSTRFNSHFSESDVTDESLFLKRRRFVKAGISLSAMAYFPQLAMAAVQGNSEYSSLKRTIDLDLEPSSYKDITTYNNFYELGYGKGDPVANAAALKTEPWSVTVEGECEKPGTYALEDILKPHNFEERLYRLRCVEAWSMVVPWAGFPLAALLKRFQPNSKAKYVAFETLYDERNPLPGQRRDVLAWPYREGLRIDEAMHPLSFIATGIYGKPLPNQNGAPLRLVVPWKYGFKSIKSIVKISFTETQPETSWNLSGPREYGFYANVNPEVSHPRWSQKRERVIGKLFKQPTLRFNGYEDQVATMYANMDLRKNY